MTNVAREMGFAPSMLDATTLLSSCDQEIVNLFAKYERVQSLIEKQNLVEMICKTSMINMQIEEEIFHPVLKVALKEKGIVSSVTMSHARLKYLISEIENIHADSEIYDIKIRVLGEHVKEYVKEKQTRLFPKANTSGKIDLWRLGEQLALRKEELKNMFASR
ncbi:MAG: hemerythrin domain-containing protein [Pseudomonadota bacterium]